MAAAIAYNYDVAELSGDFSSRLPQWQKVRDAIAGEEMVKDRGTAYLPKSRGQNPRDYANYKARASFYSVTDLTLRGLTGLVFRVEPALDLPSKLDGLKQSLTPEGYSPEQAVREAVKEVLGIGRYGILTDMSARRSVNNIPYLATYKAEDIINWEEIVEDGVRKPVRVVLIEEPSTTADVTTRVIRELVINDEGTYEMRLWEELTDERATSRRRGGLPSADYFYLASGSFEYVETIVPLMFSKPLTEIPFVFVNPLDHRPRTDKPPMLDLVNTNLAHYRNSADYEQALWLTSQPTPYIFGIDDNHVPKSIGSATIWHAPDPNVRAGMLEFQGPGIQAQERAMEKKEDRMAIQGARIIRDFQQPNVKAETVRLQAQSETSVLVAAVQSVEEAFEKSLRFAARWAGSKEGEVDLHVNRDFIETRLTPPEILAIVTGWQSGAYSRQTMHEQWQRGEIVPPERTMEEELELIEKDDGDLIGRASDIDERVSTAVERALVAKKAGGGAEGG
jgi:hypothetical protein